MKTPIALVVHRRLRRRPDAAASCPPQRRSPPQTVRAVHPAAGAAGPARRPPASRRCRQRPELAPRVEGDSDEAEAANVKIEVTITYQVGNAAPVRRTATLTVADQGAARSARATRWRCRRRRSSR